MVGTYEIGDIAYVKAILHSVKHNTCAVNGLLIGESTGDGIDDSRLQIRESVPLFHSHLALLPMLELALLQVDEYLCAQGGKLQIVGYYHANERFDDLELSPVARKIGDHIARYCQKAVILLIDSNQLATLPGSNSRKPAMQLYLRDANRVWKQGGQSGTVAELVSQETSANKLLKAYMEEGRHESVVDFDEHLDDITKDWMNQALFD
ncbi:hypothetical protein L7F22_026965 [Adiantum nelumboides]|nr:hypothetical protein [Adiantum nelumboides]